jgi:hypothetical protein
MASSSFIGIISSEPSGLKKIDQELEWRIRQTFCNKFLIGIDLGYDPYEEPGEIPVVIGYWYDR